MQIFKILVLLVFAQIALPAFSQNDNSAAPQFLLEPEKDDPDPSSNPAFQKALSGQIADKAERKRVTTINPQSLLSGRRVVTLNMFDGVSIRVVRTKLTHHKDISSYSWEGLLQTKEYPDHIFEDGVQLGEVQVSGELLKKELLGVTFTITEWNRSNATGKSIQSYRRDPESAWGQYEGTDAYAEGFEKFLTVQGALKVPKSDIHYSVEPVADDPRFHIVLEVDHSKIKQSTDVQVDPNSPSMQKFFEETEKLKEQDRSKLEAIEE